MAEYAGPAAAVPRRPLPARRRRRRASRAACSTTTAGPPASTLIEWPDRLGAALPAERLDVVIDGSGDEPRDDRAHRTRRRLRAIPRRRSGERASRRPRDRHRDDAHRRGARRARRRRARRGRLAGGLPPRRDAAPARSRRCSASRASTRDAIARGRRRHGPGRVHGAARRDRDRQGPRPRPAAAHRRRRDRRGAARRPRPGTLGAIAGSPPAARRPVRPRARPRRRRPRTLLPAGGHRPTATLRTPATCARCRGGPRRPRARPTRCERGERARAGLARGARPARARRGWPAATSTTSRALVPEYVTLPRGRRRPRAGRSTWSHDRR